VKRLISAVAVLFLMIVAVPMFALDARSDVRNNTAAVVDEVIRMSQAGVADEDIIAYVQKSHDRFDVTADDLIALTNAKVSKSVIHGLVAEADDRNGDRDRERVQTRTVVAPRVYVGSPWFWDPFYYYDPFWYGPRLSISFGHYRGGYRGGFHHHR